MNKGSGVFRGGGGFNPAHTNAIRAPGRSYSRIPVLLLHPLAENHPPHHTNWFLRCQRPRLTLSCEGVNLYSSFLFVFLLRGWGRFVLDGGQEGKIEANAPPPTPSLTQGLIPPNDMQCILTHQALHCVRAHTRCVH